MSTEIKNVVLIGAGGNLGVTMLQEFIAANTFNVTVLSRASSKTTFPAGVRVVKTDYSASSLEKDFAGQDAVVSIVGNEGFAAQKSIIDAAIAAGVKRFIPSEFGSNTADERVRNIVPIFAGKRAVVDYLKTKESEISWSAVIPGPFADWGIQTGFLGFNTKDQVATIYDKGTVPVSLSSLSQIGKATVKILEHTAETANQYVYISSFEVTQQQLLQALEKATGAKWKVEEKDTKDVIKVSTEKVASGDYSGIPGLILGACYGDFPDGPYGDWTKVPGGSWNAKLGLKEETVEDVVKKALA